MKQDIKDFIYKLLSEHKLKGIVDHGTNFRCQCPYHYPKHNFTTFSISYVNESKSFWWNCFSCGESGNIMTLVMHLQNVDYKQAERIFIKQVVIAPITLDAIQKSYNKINYIATDYTEKIHPEIDMPPKFEKARMMEYLNWRNQTLHHGLIDWEFIANRYKLYYCDQGRYRQRVIMPIKDLNGRNVYFTNRSIQHDNPKKNLFVQGSNADHFIYGLYEAVGRKKVIITEGPFEVYQLRSHAMRERINDFGFVAVMGTEISPNRCIQLAECFEEAYILFDSEDQVLKGTWKDGKFTPGKEQKAHIVLSDYMRCHKMTKILHPGKEPSSCNQRQLKEIFKFKTTKNLRFAL